MKSVNVFGYPISGMDRVTFTPEGRRESPSSSYMLGYGVTAKNIDRHGRDFLLGLVVSLAALRPEDEDIDDFWRGQADAALASMGLEL